MRAGMWWWWLGLFVSACGGATSGPPPSMDGGPLGACAACADDELCVDGECAALPSSCPCPDGAYCDLASDRCVLGCLEDLDCGEGSICESRACVTGCRDDAACGRGSICEDAVCRAGCRRDSGCESTEICERQLCRRGCREDADCPVPGSRCDATALTCQTPCTADADCVGTERCVGSFCTAACLADSDCGAGRVCGEGLCLDACTSSDECALGMFCDLTAGGCREGCGGGATPPDVERCAVGEACVLPDCPPGSPRCDYVCQTECRSVTDLCRSADDAYYSCFVSSASGEAPRCRRDCRIDPCPAGEVCTDFRTRHEHRSDPRRFCASACVTDEDCAGMSTFSVGGRCQCQTSGQCGVGPWFEDRCYTIEPSYGL